MKVYPRQKRDGVQLMVVHWIPISLHFSVVQKSILEEEGAREVAVNEKLSKLPPILAQLPATDPSRST